MADHGLTLVRPPLHRIPHPTGFDLVTCDDLTHTTCLGGLAAQRGAVPA